MRGQASRQNQDLRDYRIFRILTARVFKRQALTRICIGGISGCGEKRRLGEIEILKIPRILKILILTKTMGWRNKSITRNQARLRRRDARRSAYFPITKLPAPSTRAAYPGGISVVESGCSIMAGDGAIMPGDKSSRR